MTMVTFGQVSGFPAARHLLRRFYENNAKILATVPRHALTVVDYTEPFAEKAVVKCVFP
jgi:hypothetical protein